jgi:uncharacterized protein with FMN-binding domain
MKRTPIVVLATAAGLAGVLAFHSTPGGASLGVVPGAPAGSQLGHGLGAQFFPQTAASQPVQPVQSGSDRTAVGPAVNYNYGVLAVRVTVSGRRLVKVLIASLQDAGMYRSHLIDHQAIPVLETQALHLQDANIQGVSGASFTSAAFAQSLQGALHSLGLP